MEGNLPTSNMIPAPYGALALQNSMHRRHPQASFHHHQQQFSSTQHQSSMAHPPIHHLQDGNQQPGAPIMDSKKGKHGKSSMTYDDDDDDDPIFTEDGVDGQNDAGKGKKCYPWQRMKWTDGMVRLLITALSYMGEDAMLEHSGGGRRKNAILQKMGKWKSISKVMAQRGCYVSPQQCEDKFNDLNKRYRRLVDILGRGTACSVVENPALLDQMEHISDKLKDVVKKILNSKQLFYEEMCSYHNGNRLYLPHDPELQWSLQLALRSGDEHDKKMTVHGGNNEDDRSADTADEQNDAQEHAALHGNVRGSCFLKRMKHLVDHKEVGIGKPSGSQGCARRPHPQGISMDMNQVLPEGSTVTWGLKHSMSSHSLKLEEQRLDIQLQMLELERQFFKWQNFSKKKDRELNKMRMENERMKVENERLAMELKCREVDLGLKRNQ